MNHRNIEIKVRLNRKEAEALNKDGRGQTAFDKKGNVVTYHRHQSFPWKSKDGTAKNISNMIYDYPILLTGKKENSRL